MFEKFCPEGHREVRRRIGENLSRDADGPSIGLGWVVSNESSAVRVDVSDSESAGSLPV